MEKIDVCVILASLMLLFTLVLYLDQNEKRWVEWRDAPAQTIYERELYQCEVYNNYDEDMTAEQLLDILRQVDSIVEKVAVS
jgi:hypothetical protein